MLRPGFAATAVLAAALAAAGPAAARTSTGFFADGPHGELAACNMYDWPGLPEYGVICAARVVSNSSLYSEAKLLRNGQVQICSHSRTCPWTFDDPQGAMVGVGKIVTTGPFRCQVLTTVVKCTLSSGRGFQINRSAAMQVGTPAPPPSGVPVFGNSFYRSVGFGQAHPANISFGGADALFKMANIRWTNWGAAQTTGFGTGWYLPPDAQSNSQGHVEREEIVAFDLGTCKGKRAYLQMKWWFPAHRNQSDVKPNSICGL